MLSTLNSKPSEPRLQTVHIVHCIDTEGPLWESIEATFERLRTNVGVTIEIDPTTQNLRRLQNREISLNGLEDEVASILKPQLLAYNETWDRVDGMLRRIMSPDFRNEMIDSF